MYIFETIFEHEHFKESLK